MKQEIAGQHLDALDIASSWGTEALADAGFWLPVSMLMTIFAVQVVKGILKEIVPRKHKPWRKLGTFVLAFIIGFTLSVFFLEGAHIYQWSVVVGLSNPFVYIALKTLAENRGWATIQAVLKGRPAHVDNDGGISFRPDETLIGQVVKKREK